MMVEKVRRGEGGQVLVQVALGLVVLLLAAGLAIDGGNVYGERRSMQNAADAGALAGARAVCDGNAGEAEAIAIYYAEDLNGADLADVDIDLGAGIVRVTANKEADTFLMGLAGFETMEVTADATAQCGLAGSAGGVVPIAFDWETWDTKIDCDENTGGDGFIVWADPNGSQRSEFDLCEDYECEPLEEVLDDHAEWSGDISGALGASDHIGPGNRGWLRLGAAPEGDEYERDDYDANPPGDCGANALGFWMRNGYPAVDPFTCVAAEPGVVASMLNQHAPTRVGDTVTIVLYNEDECDRDEAVGQCPGGGGTKYLKVEGFGCAKIVKVYGPPGLSLEEKNSEEDDQGGGGNSGQGKGGNSGQGGGGGIKSQALLAIKVCGDSCNTMEGGSTGDSPESGRVSAVSLIE